MMVLWCRSPWCCAAGALYPDAAIGVAPLSGMANIATTEVAKPSGVPHYCLLIASPTLLLSPLYRLPAALVLPLCCLCRLPAAFLLFSIITAVCVGTR